MQQEGIPARQFPPKPELMLRRDFNASWDTMRKEAEEVVDGVGEAVDGEGEDDDDDKRA